MKINRYIFRTVACVAGMVSFAACSDDEFTSTIFPDVSDEPDPASYTYKFDTWLNQNFRDVYNLQFYYKMKDVESVMDYNLVPAKYDKARDLALLTKYLWFDSYAELYNSPKFTQQYGPRIIHLIGSSAHNPSTGTEILGLAEGGLKVSLFKVNELDVANINQLNEYYFRTMHHEFAHILHQTKSYPTDFNLLSNGRYDPSSWQDRNGGVVASEGFITPYSSDQTREDFAETIANYLTRTDEQLDVLMWSAAMGWDTGLEKNPDEDPSVKHPYYCYYYFKDNAARVNQQRTYFFEFVDRPLINGVVDCRVGLKDEAGNVYFSVPDIENFINSKDEGLRAAQRSYEAQNTFKKSYSQLTAQEKTAVDRIVQEMQFIFPVEDTDGVDGAAIILQKQNIARNWFKDVWGLDFDGLRKIVQKRQAEVSRADGTSIIDELRAAVDAIPDPAK